MRKEQTYRKPKIDRLIQDRSVSGRWKLLMLQLLFLFSVTVPALAQKLPGSANDTLPIDTIEKAEKIVAERTEWLNPSLLTDLQSHRKKASNNLEQVMYPDLHQRLDGFSHYLGQISKPYRRYLYGAESAFFRNGLFENPVTGAEDVYFIQPERGVRYFDTRTPYVNLYYGQGKSDLAQLRVDVSQNISPLVNVSLLYYRRQSNGLYTDFGSDENNLGASFNFHTVNERYQIFANWLYQGHKDQLNGGVAQFFDYEDLFSKGSQPVALTGANLVRTQRSLYYRQFYRINKDTVDKAFQLQVYNSALYSQFLNQFSDTLIDIGLNNVQFPVYPTFSDSLNYFFEKYRMSRLKMDAGFSFKFKKPGFQTTHRVELAQEFRNYRRTFQDYTQNMFTPSLKGNMVLSPDPFELVGDYRFSTTTSSLFSQETFMEVGASLQFPKWRVDYTETLPGPFRHEKDSVKHVKIHRPFGVFARFINYDRNPTFQQVYGVTLEENTYSPKPNLQNRRMEHFRVGVEWRTKDNWNKYGVTKGTHVQFSAFRTRMHNMVYFDSLMTVQQQVGSWYEWMGLEAKVRLKFWHLAFESTTVVQQMNSSSAGLAAELLNFQPWLYGRARLFFENKDLKFAAILRFGLEYHYHVGFQAPLFDAPSQQFYPQQEFLQPGYHRIDVFAATQVKKAFLYAKMINLTEGLMVPGYFTTLFYPMRDRQFVLGVNWTFFD